MTLISGTLHWKGTCFTADTRGTIEETKSFADCYQKFCHIHGGIAMAISGDAIVGIELSKVLRKNLDEVSLSGFKLKPNESSEPSFKETIEKSLEDLQNNNVVKNMSTEVSSQGLISMQDMGMKLHLDPTECENLINISCSSHGIGLNSYYQKYIEDIFKCYRNEIPFIEIEDCYQNFLFEYSVRINPITNEIFSEVKRVRFGEIKAFGSGSGFNYKENESRILSFVLLSPESELIDNASLHLAMLHGIAETNVNEDPDLGFKTFGGSIITGYVITDKNGMSRTNVVLGTQKRKSDNTTMSDVSERDGKLFVVGEDGTEQELITFPKVNNSLGLKLKA